MTAPNLTLVTVIPDPDPVAALLPVRAVDLYKQLRGLDEPSLCAFLGILASVAPDLTAELLDITGAPPCK